MKIDWNEQKSGGEHKTPFAGLARKKNWNLLDIKWPQSFEQRSTAQTDHTIIYKALFVDCLRAAHAKNEQIYGDKLCE